MEQSLQSYKEMSETLARSISINRLLRRLTNLLSVDLQFCSFNLVRMVAVICFGGAISMEAQANSSDICSNFWKYACENREVSAKADDWVGESNRSSPYIFGGRAHQIYQEAFSKKFSTSRYYPRWLKFKKVMGAPFTEDVLQTVKNYEALYTQMGSSQLLEQIAKQLALTDGKAVNADEYLFLENWDNKLLRNVENLAFEQSKLKKHPVHKKYDAFLKQPFEDELPEVRKAVSELRLYCSVFPDSLCSSEFRKFLKSWHQGYFEPAHLELGARSEFRISVMERVFPTVRRKQIQTIFSDLKRIAREMFTGHLTEAELDKFDGTEVIWPDQNGEIPFQKIAYGQNGYYDSQHTKNIVILGGYSDMSDYDLWRVIAHEYGHALDLKEIGPNMTKVTDHLRICLQRPTSVKAYPEQLKEAVADWIAFELLARYYSSRLAPFWQLAALQKSTLQLGILTCAAPQQSIDNPLLGPAQITVHPPWDARANRIFMAHPYFRSLFGCSQEPDGPEHCEMP